MFSNLEESYPIAQTLNLDGNRNEIIMQRLSLNEMDSINIQDFEETQLDFNRNEKWCERIMMPTDPCDELLSAGYTDCMVETIRYLIEEENLEPENPVVRNLIQHLESSRNNLLANLSYNQVRATNNNSNIPTKKTKNHKDDTSYECFISVNLLENSNECDSR